MSRNNSLFARTLSNKQQLAVFGKGPEAVLDNEFELVYLTTDGLHVGTDGVVVLDGTLVDALNAVGYATGLGEVIDELLDALGALGYLLDELQVTGAETFGFLKGKDIFHALHVLDELGLVVGADGDDVVHGEIAQDTGLNLYGLDVHLPLDLVAGLKLLAVHDLGALEHADGGIVEVVLEDDGARLLDVKTATGGFGNPGFAVAVAVEADGAAGADVVAQNVEDGVVLGCVAGAAGKLGLDGVLGDTGIDALLERGESLGHGGVEGYHGAGTVDAGAGGTELEAVAGEGEGAGAVSVGIIDNEVGNLGDVYLTGVLLGEGRQVGVLLDGVEEAGDVVAEERGDDGGRCLVATETVGVGGRHDGGLEQAVVLIDGHQRLDDEGDEAEILLGRLAGGVEEGAVIGGEAPVAVLAGAVDAVEGLFVQQDTETVLAGDALHERHEEHVVIDGKVALLEDGGELELVGSYLVMARLTGNGELKGLYLEVFHEGLDTVGDGAEVVIVHLLVLGTLVTHEGATGHEEVGTGAVEAFVDEEVLLLPAEIDGDLLDIVVEELADVGGSAANGVEGAQQGSLVVESLACVGNKDGGDTECVVDDEDRARGVPGAVAAGLEGVADTTVGER